MGNEGTWRPLGIDGDNDIAEYDALHDGIMQWMSSAFWAWVRESITRYRRYSDGSGSVAHLNEDLVESMCQTLRVSLPNLRYPRVEYTIGQEQLDAAMNVLQNNSNGLQIADYILASSSDVAVDDLEKLLARSKSVWSVGLRSGKQGLVRRVPLGVQVGAESVMDRAEGAGVRLAKAWENVYGIDPNASEAYRLAILAVEDSAIPVVSPANSRATLGTVLKQICDQRDWSLPMGREDSRSPSRDVLMGMMRLLWQGQHDRHGGQPTAPGNVSQEEAIAAVGLATTLVHWFTAGVVERRKAPSDDGMDMTLNLGKG